MNKPEKKRPFEPTIQQHVAALICTIARQWTWHVTELYSEHHRHVTLHLDAPCGALLVVVVPVESMGSVEAVFVHMPGGDGPFEVQSESDNLPRVLEMLVDYGDERVPPHEDIQA